MQEDLLYSEVEAGVVDGSAVCLIGQQGTEVQMKTRKTLGLLALKIFLMSQKLLKGKLVFWMLLTYCP